MLDELTSTQLSEWEAYDRIDPIGTWRDDFRMSYLAALLTNIAIRTNAKKGTPLVSLSEFILDWDIRAPREIKKQSVTDMRKALLGLAKIQNKKVRIVGIQPELKEIKSKKNGKRTTGQSDNNTRS